MPLRPDTLAWARLRARVVGVDLAEPAVDAARALAARTELGAIVTALAAAGLRIESLVERPTLVMQRWPFQVEHGHQDWRNPPELPQIPLTFSLLAQKPVGS